MMLLDMLWGQVQLAMQERRLDAAAMCAEQILRAAPRHSGALHIMGVISLQRRQMPEALRWLKKACQADDRNAMIWATSGYAFFETDNFRDAAEAFQKAIKLDPRAHPALHGLGKSMQALGRPWDAADTFGRALALDPRNVDYLNDRGVALLETSALHEALQHFEAALALAPGFFGALLNKGLALKKLGKEDASLAALDQAVAINPGYSPAHSARAAVLLALGKHSEALAASQTAIELDSTNAQAYFTKATIYDLRSDHALSAEAYRLGLNAAPKSFESWNNLGVAEAALGRHSVSLECYNRALALSPDFADAQFNKSLNSLLRGDLAEGFRLWEFRTRKTAPVVLQKFGLPVWTGKQNISGRKILVFWEQGFGDTIQFVRYVPLLQEKGAQVALMVQPELAPLIRRVMPEVDLVDVEPGDATLQIPLMSLPRAFGTVLENIPSAPLWPPDDALRDIWRVRLGTRAGPRIGVSWRGSSGHSNDSNRSLPLRHLVTLINHEAAWFGIQKGMPASDREAIVGQSNLVVFDDKIRDFEDTAALIAELDLIVSVDTSLAHLAGSMGRECWVMLPFNPDWRWMLDRHDSPWYSSLRLFRQKQPGDWASVLENLCAAISQRFE